MVPTQASGKLPAPAPRHSAIGLPALGTLTAFAYVVILGGTDFGEVLPPLQLVNGFVAGGLIVWYVFGLRRADRIDRLVLLAFVLFAGAALLSSFPRQSLDATLAALTYTAGFFVARDLLRRHRVRDAFIRVMVVLSLVVTVVTASVWLSVVVGWWSLMGWTVSPPLGLELPGGAWGHRHDVALLIAMLYPSWWIRRPSPLRRMAGVVVGVLAVFVVLIDGSRMLWLALVAATVVGAGPTIVRRWPRRARINWLIGGAGLAAVVVLFAAGVAAPLVERAASLTSLGYRGAMWGQLTEAWLAHPIGGLGPGSFAWVLQTTGYFDANSWAPRHPDSALFQLLPEAGLLGLLAILSLAVALVPAILRGRSAGARWALIAFATAGIGANPTDFAFLVVVAVAWAAFSVPREPVSAGVDERPAWGWTRFATLAALGVIGIAYLSTIAAAFSFTNVAAAVRKDDLDRSEASLTTAINLDPGMALYWRERGTIRLIRGEPAAATGDLEQAVARNPSDDLAWRTLALAHAAAGDAGLATATADRAVATQRSDPSNLLLAARLAIDAGRDTDALDQLSQVVQAWPEVMAAPGWEALIVDANFGNTEILRAAAQRRVRMDPAPRSDELLLSVITDTPSAVRLTGSDRLRLASLACEPAVADMLDAASESERREAGYWEAVVRESARRGALDDEAVMLFEILRGSSVNPAGMDDKLNPLHQFDIPAAYGVDLWGYRRVPSVWPAHEIQLPDPSAGSIRWLIDPVGAAGASGVAACS